VWGDTGPLVGIERIRLQQILVAGIEDIHCRLGTSVRGLTQRDDRVSVVFSDGSLGTYDLVAGADGITSTVHALTFDVLTFPARLPLRERTRSPSGPLHYGR
jgi:2-polyprenyl-6-methoxyphenol hydroxylase-like FAD-dependent oxidoreductase